MEIRPCTQNDYVSCKEIADQFNESAPTQEVFSELVKNSQIFVAVQKWEITWFCAYKLLWNESLFLQFLRIHKEHHRKWIASKLIQYIEEIWREKWYYEIFSTALEDNEASIKLHEKCWYRQAGYIDFDSGKELVFLKEL